MESMESSIGRTKQPDSCPCGRSAFTSVGEFGRKSRSRIILENASAVFRTWLDGAPLRSAAATCHVTRENISSGVSRGLAEASTSKIHFSGISRAMSGYTESLSSSMKSVRNLSRLASAPGKHNLGNSALIDGPISFYDFFGGQFGLLADSRCLRPQQQIVHGDDTDQGSVLRDDR